MGQFEKIKQYTAIVCEQIRWKKAHGIISEEIENHIIDQTNALIESGEYEENAIDKAITEMGDPVVVGSQLDRTHKPKTEWSIIVLTALALLMGIAIRMILPSGPNVSGAINKSIFIDAVGIVCMFAAYSIDFTIIGKYPKLIFGFLLAMSVVLLIITPNVINTALIYINGRVTGIQYLMLIFPVAFAGIIYSMRDGGYMGIINSGLMFVVSAIIGLGSNNIASVFWYAVTCLILLTYAILKGWFNVRKLYAICLIYISGFAASIFLSSIYMLGNEYRWWRLKALVNPSLDPMGAGYMNLLIRSIISDARFIGQSESLSASSQLPYIDTDYLLTYLINRFGFIALVMIMTVLLAFILRMFFLSKEQKSVLAKLVSTAVILTFSIQIAVYIANNFGFQILSTHPLPFIAYGGLATIANMTLIGIILSVFKLGGVVKDSWDLNSKPRGKFLQIIDDKIIIDISLFK